MNRLIFIIIVLLPLTSFAQRRAPVDPLAHRQYRLQRMLDNTGQLQEKVCEYRDSGKVGNQDQLDAQYPCCLKINNAIWCADRVVSPQHKTYLAWLAKGNVPQRLPDQQPPPKIVVNAVRWNDLLLEYALAQPDVAAAQRAVLDCVAASGDCKGLSDNYLFVRDAAISAATSTLSLRYEVK